eukprot:m.199812 g.199812  ORF g.199812 m.199812 type:complete len:77 (+) comp39576_c0_seq8:513-743(+)
MVTAMADFGTAVASAISSSRTTVDVTSGPTRSPAAGEAEIRSKYIAQLKDLHSLLQLGAIDDDDYEDQKMGKLKMP